MRSPSHGSIPRPAPSNGEAGNALIMVVVIVIALAGLSAAFMQTGVHESRVNTVAGEMSRVLYIAESGVNQAVGDLLTDGDGNIASADAPADFGGGRFFVATIDHGDGTFTVTSHAALNEQRRALEVVLAPEDVPLFSRALFGDLDLGAQGNVFTDSYDSDAGSYASQATNVHPDTGRTYAKARGDLGSNRNIILRGGVTVLGNATPGPGYVVKISGTNVYVDGSVRRIEANDDSTDVLDVFEGIAGPIVVTGSLFDVNIGEGIAPSGSGNGDRPDRVARRSGRGVRPSRRCAGRWRTTTAGR